MRRLIAVYAVVVLFTATSAMAGTWKTIDYPGAAVTNIIGIDGQNIVGCYQDASGNFRGFLYNGTTWTTLGYPGAVQTSMVAISGGNMIGEYTDSSSHLPDAYWNSALYNGITWTTLNAPEGIYGAYARGISGNNVVGTYADDSANKHGFVYEIPEPATLLLLGLGGLFLRKKR